MDDESVLLEDIDSILGEVGREKLSDKFKKIFSKKFFPDDLVTFKSFYEIVK